MAKSTAEIMERMAAIRSEMASLGPKLFGDLSAKKQNYRKKDGTISRQKAQAMFRYAKTSGKMTKRIPADAEQNVREMIANGKKHSVLQDELDRLESALTLEQVLKKNK